MYLKHPLDHITQVSLYHKSHPSVQRFHEGLGVAHTALLGHNLSPIPKNNLKGNEGPSKVGVESNWDSFEIRSIRFENLRFD